MLTIEDPGVDPSSPPCLSNQSRLAFSFSRSSLTVFSQSLPSNRTYQFLVQLSGRRNASIQFNASLLVQMTDADSQIVLVALVHLPFIMISSLFSLSVFSCVISTMCSSKLQYQRVNPTTQVALYSLCLGTCTSIQSITWNVYQGVNNVSSSMVNWIPFNQTNQYENIWFFGRISSLTQTYFFRFSFRTWHNKFHDHQRPIFG